jgi:hypothetical protein
LPSKKRKGQSNSIGLFAINRSWIGEEVGRKLRNDFIEFELVWEAEVE